MASNSRLLERVVPRSGRSRRLNTLNTYLHRTSSSGVPGLCKCRQCPLPSICTVIYVSCTAFRACQNPHSCRFIPVFPPNPSVAQAWATDSFLALPYVPGRKSHQANCFLLSHLHLRLVTGAGSSWRHTPESHLIFVFHSPSPQANTSILYPSHRASFASTLAPITFLCRISNSATRSLLSSATAQDPSVEKAAREKASGPHETQPSCMSSHAHMLLP